MIPPSPPAARPRALLPLHTHLSSPRSRLAMVDPAKAPGGDAGRRRHVALEMGRTAEAEEKVVTRACGAATAGVAGVGLAGAGVLVWWAVAFQPAHEQLWMVPVGLVLLGTPVIAWLSLIASGACRWLGSHRAVQAPET